MAVSVGKDDRSSPPVGTPIIAKLVRGLDANDDTPSHSDSAASNAATASACLTFVLHHKLCLSVVQSCSKWIANRDLGNNEIEGILPLSAASSTRMQASRAIVMGSFR